MNRTLMLHPAAVLSALGLFTLTLPAQADARDRCAQFTETRATLERNLSDGDAEVVLFAKGRDEGLRQMAIHLPDGREIKLKAGDNAIGLREFLFESAEPPDLPAVLAAFPAGRYQFVGTTVSGACVRGSARLSHVPAPGATLLTPMQDEEVPVDQLVLSWTAVPEADRYVIELNNEATGAEYRLDVFPPTTRLAIPAGLIEAGTEYQFVVATVTSTGNLSAVESTFTTAP